ncbi:hypothetical protein HZS_960 [Henneguya salminicola]|nr:hypothetical protein HZS_960 [Henneguya salminicola]
MPDDEYLVKASKDFSKYPNRIYQPPICFPNQKYKTKSIKISSRNQVYNRIGYLRGPSTEAVLTIEILPHNSTIAGRPFLQRLWAWNIDGEFQRFLMWSLDEGLTILWVGSELFNDAAPHIFVQCLVVMSFDASTNLFVPCVWALMSRRNEYLYCELLHAIIVQLKYVCGLQKVWLSILGKRF